jgi:hypothetical protein
MLAMVASLLIARACTHLLESLVVNKASCILGYVKLTLLDVLAELPTTEEISVSPPDLPVWSDGDVHARRLCKSFSGDVQPDANWYQREHGFGVWW